MRFALLAALVLALLVVPIGLPGVWIMVLLLGGAAWAGWIGWTTWAVVAAAAALAEVAELVILKMMGAKHGGSRSAFWGAIVGGLAGAVVGLPIPLVGAVVAGFLGTFLGAGLVTWWQTRDVGSAARVGWGVLIARTMAVGLKVGAGVAILVVGGLALFLD